MNPKAIFGNVEALLANMVDDELPTNVVAGDPKTKYGELLSQDGLDVGVWSCTVGCWDIKDYEVDEVMVLLSGKMVLTDEEGNAKELSKGDFFFIPKGWNGRWEVIEDMEKVYVIMS